MCISEWGQGLTLTHNVDWVFLPHTTFLQEGHLLSPIIYRCLLKVLCPMSRPITTLNCVLLKYNNWAPLARLGPKINSRAWLLPLSVYVAYGSGHKKQLPHLHIKWLLFVDSIWWWAGTTQYTFLLRDRWRGDWIPVGGQDFSHLSGPALGSTQCPVKWVPDLLPGGKAARAWRWPPTSV